MIDGGGIYASLSPAWRSGGPAAALPAIRLLLRTEPDGQVIFSRSRRLSHPERHFTLCLATLDGHMAQLAGGLGDAEISASFLHGSSSAPD